MLVYGRLKDFRSTNNTTNNTKSNTKSSANNDTKNGTNNDSKNGTKYPDNEKRSRQHPDLPGVL